MIANRRGGSRYPLSGFILLVVLSAGASGQAKFKSGSLTINVGGRNLNYIIEVADNDRSRSIGLMYRQTLSATQGMLLLYKKPQQANVWMKNTFLPLDIIYIDARGYIVKIIENATPQSTGLMRSGVRVKAVLELNAGQVEKHQIAIGNHVAWQVN